VPVAHEQESRPSGVALHRVLDALEDSLSLAGHDVHRVQVDERCREALLLLVRRLVAPERHALTFEKDHIRDRLVLQPDQRAGIEPEGRHEAVALVLRLGALLSGHDVDVLGVPDLDAGSLVEALPHGLGLLAFGVRTLGLLSRLARGLLALGRCGVLIDAFIVAGGGLVVFVEPGGSGLPGLQAEEHRVALVGPRQAVEVDDPQVLGERLVVQVVVARGPRRLLVKPAPGEHREGGVLVVPVGLLAHDREVRGVVAPGHAHVVRLARVERLHLARTRVDHAEPVAGLVGGVDGHREPRALLAPRKGTHATEVGVHAAREVADDEVGAVIVARLTVALHREEGAALAEGEGAHAFDGVLLTADEVEQTQVVLHGLLALGELLPLGLGLADGERQPLAVAGERRPAALLEDLRRVGGDDAQPELARAVVPADGVRDPAAVGGEDVGAQALPLAPVGLRRQARRDGGLDRVALAERLAGRLAGRFAGHGGPVDVLRERVCGAGADEGEGEQGREGEVSQHGSRCRWGSPQATSDHAFRQDEATGDAGLTAPVRPDAGSWPSVGSALEPGAGSAGWPSTATRTERRPGPQRWGPSDRDPAIGTQRLGPSDRAEDQAKRCPPTRPLRPCRRTAPGCPSAPVAPGGSSSARARRSAAPPPGCG